MANWHPEFAKLALYYKFDTANGDEVFERKPDAPPLSGEIFTSDVGYVTWDNELLKDALDAPAPPPLPPPPIGTIRHHRASCFFVLQWPRHKGHGAFPSRASPTTIT